MRVRDLIFAAAALLFIAALVVGVLAMRPHDPRVTRVSSQSRAAGVPVDGPGRQDFALTEVAVTELPPGFPPFVFVIEVTAPDGARATEVLEPAASGRVMLPPVPAGTDLAISVVAGGARYGYEWEETIGTASAKVRECGRAFVLVAIRTPAPRESPLRLFVGDPDGWPVGGARVTDAAGAWSVTTSAAGYCRGVSAAPAIRVEPPADRPDLAAFEGSPGRWEYLAEVVLRKKPVADVALPPAGDPSVPPEQGDLSVIPNDGRPFLQRITITPDRVIRSFPLGSYTVRWCAEGFWRDAELVVAAEGSRLLPARPAVRAVRVEVPGTWQGFQPTPSAALLLLERSRLSCVLPRSIVESGGFELSEGRGYTSRFVVADVDEDGTAVFSDVAPGDYEIVSMFQPYVVSGCIRIDGQSDVISVACGPRLRAAQIVGRVEGRSGARYDVQIRGRGRSFDKSRPVKCPGDYEFGDLPGGLYSVRAVADDAFQGRHIDDYSGFTPWRNVILEPGGRVTVDFHVE